MAWRVEFDPRALAELGRLDRTAQKRMVKFFEERIARHASPRDLGRALTGEKTGLWRYRIGDFRAICLLEDGEQLIRVLRVAHRKEAYR